MAAVPHHPLCGKEIMPVKQPPKSAKEAAVEIGKIVEAMFCGSYAPLRECEINEFAEIISDLLATARKEAREAAFKIWHSASEEMPARKEIVVIHKGCISIGDKRELEMINFIDAWCTREDLVTAALERAATTDTDNIRQMKEQKIK